MASVQFDNLKYGTAADFQLMAKEYRILCSPEELTNRSLSMLTSQRGIFGAAKVDLYEHGLQAATRAYKNGEDEETIVCCLLHDIGELLSPSNHGEISAGILRPYISKKWYWILANHEVFQGFYYFHHMSADRNAREIYKDNPFYQEMIDFCENYDAPSFDPKFESFNIDFFRPMVLRIFSKAPYLYDDGNPKQAAVVGEGPREEDELNNRLS